MADYVNHQDNDYEAVRLMYQDEASFGRISDPSSCWCFPGFRPIVSSLRIREYRHAFGAVSPQDGENFFLVLPYCNTDCMNIFLQKLSAEYPKDYILLATDQATWHTSTKLVIPENIKIFLLPPRTPELNPIEQVWKEIRKLGFKNKLFHTLNKVIDQLCNTVNSLTNDMIKSITGREWILSMF